MIEQPKIELCPVCGHVAEPTDDSEGYETPTFYVFCTAGGCLLGPNRPTAAEAITQWNRLSLAVSLIEDIDNHVDGPEWIHGSDSDDNGSWIATCEGRSILRTMIEDYRKAVAE